MGKLHPSKKTILPILFLTLVFQFLPLYARPINPTKWLKKPFMNHNNPGSGPQIFSPGLISGSNQEHSSLTISPDSKIIMWSQWPLPRDPDKSPQVIKMIRFTGRQWTLPETVSFSGKWRDGGPAFSPDGKRIYFYSRRPLDDHKTTMKDNDIWYVEQSRFGWGKPVNLGRQVNSSFVDAAPSLANNGNLYFVSNRNRYPDPIGNNDLFVAKFKQNRFRQAKALGKGINTSTARESFPFIAPDESYLIFVRDSRKFQNNKKISGERRMMVSFRNSEGKFEEAVDMGDQFEDTRFPYVTRDRGYFIFSRYTKGHNEDFYFVSGKVIDSLQSTTRQL